MLAQLVLSAAALAATIAQPTPVEFCMAPGGDDHGPGTVGEPFATLEGARDALRRLRAWGDLPLGGVRVLIRDGVYELAGTFELATEDSGTEAAPVEYAAYPGEHPRLLGGRRVSGFAPVADPALLALLPQGARGHVLQVDLRKLGITDYGEMRRRGFGMGDVPAGLEVFMDGLPMTLARWPNGEWTKIAGVPDGAQGGRFAYEGDRPSRWLSSKDIWVHGCWTWDWADSYEKVAGIDTAARVIATEPPHGVYGYAEGRRYYALNVLEELDSPGEWYLDRGTGVLCFWPPSDPSACEVTVSILEQPIIALDGASFVTLRGLSLECCRGRAVTVTGGSDNLIAGCVIADVGTTAVIVDGAQRSGVEDCDISHCGCGGISLGGGDRPSLRPGGNYAVNNDISDFGRICKTYTPGVLVSGVGNRVASNLLRDAPHSAIILGGNEHLIELNEVRNVGNEVHDAGAFYMGRDYTQRGNIVRRNFFHDIGGGDFQAIYLDDWTSDTKVIGNICQGAMRGILIGGGRDNLVEGNVFVDCQVAVHIDARGLGWAKSYFDGTDNTLWQRLDAMSFRKPPYSERYPGLLTLLDDDPAIPKGNVVRRNVAWRCGQWFAQYDIPDVSVITFEDNLTEGDPLFLDPDHRDYRLRDGSPVWALGFERIPVEEIGLRR